MSFAIVALVCTYYFSFFSLAAPWEEKIRFNHLMTCHIVEISFSILRLGRKCRSAFRYGTRFPANVLLQELLLLSQVHNPSSSRLACSFPNLNIHSTVELKSPPTSKTNLLHSTIDSTLLKDGKPAPGMLACLY